MSDTDVFIIGGGPAGLAAGIAARRVGLRVVVVDGNAGPIDKACGEGLMPDALTAASRLGITIPRSLGYPFRGIRFLGDCSSVDASFPRGFGLGVRRTVLHQVLIEHAHEAGVELRWNTPVSSLAGIRARWIVGADGGASRVRRMAGLESFARNTRRFAFRRHFAIAPWTDCMEIYWAPKFQIYVTPVTAREICVAGISRDPHLRLTEMLTHVPILRGVPPTTAERGAISATTRLRHIARGNVVLIGDASGSVDAITGEGLCLSFQQAAALAEAFQTGSLEGYVRHHRAIGRRPEFMADFMLLMDRFPLVRKPAIRALSALPGIFARLLAIHLGNSSPEPA